MSRASLCSSVSTPDNNLLVYSLAACLLLRIRFQYLMLPGLLLAGLCMPSHAQMQTTETDIPDNPALPAMQPVSEYKALPGPGVIVRVALVDSGVNYLLPAINQRLARRANGSMLGYDFWDLDDLPFDSHPSSSGRVVRHGTKTASLLLREAPMVELVPYRYPRPDMTRMTDLVLHAVEHDVRIVGLPLGGNLKSEWLAFESAARAHPEVLFVASAGNNSRDIDKKPVYPASLGLDNMLVVTSADDFVRPAEGVNRGRIGVDYLIPAEN